MTLALLGLLVELAGFTPVFAAEGERPEEALARVRPTLVVLIDDTLDAARSDVFFARAAQRRVALAVFPGRTSRREQKTRIGERGIPYFELPTDAADLARTIRARGDRVPIVMVSGFVDPLHDIEIEGLSLLQKPLDGDSLVSAVEAALRSR